MLDTISALTKGNSSITVYSRIDFLNIEYGTSEVEFDIFNEKVLILGSVLVAFLNHLLSIVTTFQADEGIQWPTIQYMHFKRS